MVASSSSNIVQFPGSTEGKPENIAGNPNTAGNSPAIQTKTKKYRKLISDIVTTGQSMKVNQQIHDYIGKNRYFSVEELMNDIHALLKMRYHDLDTQVSIGKNQRYSNTGNIKYITVPETPFVVQCTVADTDESNRRYNNLKDFIGASTQTMPSNNPTQISPTPFVSIVQDKCQVIESYRHPLSGLLNERFFSKYAKEKHATLISIDLNGLKEWNDTGGHATGDYVIKLLARSLKLAVREGDLACHVSGDEFWIAAQDVKQESDVQNIIDRIHSKMEEEAAIDRIRGEERLQGKDLPTFAYGYAMYDKSMPFTGQKHIADKNMQKNKDEMYARQGIEGQDYRIRQAFDTITDEQQTSFLKAQVRERTPEELEKIIQDIPTDILERLLEKRGKTA